MRSDMMGKKEKSISGFCVWWYITIIYKNYKIKKGGHDIFRTYLCHERSERDDKKYEKWMVDIFLYWSQDY
mgnify:CR=1 FL=1